MLIKKAHRMKILSLWWDGYLMKY